MSQKNTRVGVGIFVWKDDRFLMGKRRGSHGHDTWSIPGGHLEFGESFEECAKREVFEETGMLISNVRLLAVTNDFFPKDDKHYATVWVESDWKAKTPIIKEPDKWIDQQWHNFQTLPTPLFEPCWKNLKAEKPELFSR